MRTTLSPTGFTLIELLVVIAVIGVLAGAIIVLINPTAILDRARIAQGKSFQGQLARNLGFSSAAEWKFNDTSTPGLDSSGNQLTGTLTGGASYTANCDLGMEGCISFDGVNGYINTSGVDLTTGNWTMSAWIYPTAYGPLWRKVFGSTVGGYEFGIANGSLDITIASVADATVSTITPPLNKWSLITATFTDSTNSLTYYVDGKKANTVTFATAPTGGVKTSYIGAYGASSQFFQGKIDEAYIFKEAVSQATIENYYSKSLAKRLDAPTPF